MPPVSGHFLAGPAHGFKPHPIAVIDGHVEIRRVRHVTIGIERAQPMGGDFKAMQLGAFTGAERTAASPQRWSKPAPAKMATKHHGYAIVVRLVVCSSQASALIAAVTLRRPASKRTATPYCDKHQWDGDQSRSFGSRCGPFGFGGGERSSSS